MWPPAEADLSWRPDAAAPNDAIPVSLLDEGDELPAWVAAPSDVERTEYEELEVPAYRLADVLTDAGRPGGVGISSIWAVPTKDGPLRIVIVNDDEIPFTSPIEEVAELPTLGELLRILDGTLVDGESYGVGHPTRVMNDEEHREQLRGFLTIRSGFYPQLEALDQARLEQWIAERP